MALLKRDGARGKARPARNAADAPEAPGRRRPRSRRRRLIGWLLPLAGLSGCMLVGALTSEPPPFAFPHAVHAEEGLGCTDCHRGAEESDQPGMPVLKQCKLCHAELDAEKPPERRVEALFDGDHYRGAGVSALDEEIVFSHQRHVTAEVECSACHQGIETNTRVDRSLAVDMDDCMRCHQQQGKPNDCATCHRDIRTDVPPRTHQQLWKRVHGKVVRGASEARIDNCALCHTQSACATCHQDVPPDNHDNYFRRRGHGLFARMDRQNCATCHRSDSCDACHAEVRPLNHTGMWGGTRSNHCVSCHFPLQSQECIVCHKGTPSHALAAPKPSWHTPGMNCLQCHGVSLPLPHVHKGDDCNACHR